MSGNIFDNQVYDGIRREGKRRLLLHCCCGPCAAGTLANIADLFDITAIYYNPNILPKEEFSKRLSALKTVLSHFGVQNLVVPAQSENDFLSSVRGLETAPEGGARCNVCFELRLGFVAQYFSMHRDNFDMFATTLTLSPHKNAPLINEIGLQVAERYDAVYLPSDFKKQDGYLKSVRLCDQLGVYRQNYCGCRLGTSS